MFKLRYIGRFKHFKFLGPVYTCYKVIEENDIVWFYCYRWDYMRFEWMKSDEMRPVLKLDTICFIFLILCLAFFVI